MRAGTGPPIPPGGPAQPIPGKAGSKAGTAKGPPLPAFAGHKTSRNKVRDRILLPILSHRKIMAKILRSDDVSSRTIYPEKIEILFVRFPVYLYIHANESCPQTFYLNYVLMKNLFIVIGSLTADARDALAGAIGGAILGSGAGGVEAGPRAVVGELSNGASGSISEAIDKWLN